MWREDIRCSLLTAAVDAEFRMDVAVRFGLWHGLLLL